MATEDQLQEFKEAFEVLNKDEDGNDKGYITPQEFRTCVRSLGANPSEKELEEVLKGIGKEKITFDDFVPYMTKKAKETDSLEDIIEAFKIFDKGGNGYLDVHELRHILMNLGEKFTEEEADEVCKSIDDGSGQVAYEELAKHCLA